METVPTTSEDPAKVKGSSHFLRVAALQCVVLIAILVWPSVIEARRLESVQNAASWLDVQVGTWIIAHRAVPNFGVFSRSSDLPWADPNWGLQTGLALLYRLVGVKALPVSVMILDLLFAMATFSLARGRPGRFWLAIAITLWAQVGLLGSFSSPNIVCSAALFAFELDLLARSRESGRQKLLYWIPLLIVVWVNVDWRFLIGVVVFVLFCGVSAIEPYLKERYWYFSHDRQAPPRPLLGFAAGAVCVAPVASPGFYHAYVHAWQNLFGPSLVDNSILMKSLSFREPQHYLLMFLAMAAFLALGRQKAHDIFQVLLLAGAVCLGFALGTEAWIVAVASVAVIGEFFSQNNGSKTKPECLPGMALSTATAISAIIITIVATRIPSNPDALLRTADTSLPIRACEFIRDQHLPGPIYNEISWGGFLAWCLPDYPVAIDDRYELYGEDKTAFYYKVTRGFVAPSSDSDFASAKTIILSSENGLIRGVEAYPKPEEMFRITFPGFRQVYKDELAVVLTKQP